MGCCCSNTNNTSNDQSSGEDTSNNRCICTPYKDVWMKTFLVVAIVATLISWMWWVTFLINLVGLVLVQILWCRRPTRDGMIIFAIMAGLCGLSQLGVGIYILVQWNNVDWCTTFLMWVDDDDAIYDDDYGPFCAYTVWATLALLCGSLWVAVTSYLLFFVGSGQYTRWETQYDNKQTTQAEVEVELEEIPTASHAVDSQGPMVEATVVAISSETYKGEENA